MLGNKVQALVYFKKACEAGYTDYSHIKEDTDLDNIRDEKKFQALASKLRNVGD